VASKYKLYIKSGDLSGTTGHHTINVYVKEIRDDGTIIKGIPEVYGIESVALSRRHDGNIFAWRDWVGREMVAKHKQRMLANAEVLKWRDQEFDVTE
jgi:hypothetical protein